MSTCLTMKKTLKISKFVVMMKNIGSAIAENVFRKWLNFMPKNNDYQNKF